MPLFYSFTGFSLCWTLMNRFCYFLLLITAEMQAKFHCTHVFEDRDFINACYYSRLLILTQNKLISEGGSAYCILYIAEYYLHKLGCELNILIEDCFVCLKHYTFTLTLHFYCIHCKHWENRWCCDVYYMKFVAVVVVE